MKSPFNFLVKPLDGKRYNNTKKVGDKEVFLTTSFEDARSTQRHAIVVSTPIGYEGGIKPGAIILVHHNTFRKLIALSGDIKSTASHVFDDTFMVMPEHVFLYKNEGDDEWTAEDNFVFVRPVQSESKYSHKKYEKLWGEVVYSNEHLSESGVSVGDTICHEPECEYEFDVDGEVLYRMFTRNICLKK
jgi:hypothetical protein